MALNQLPGGVPKGYLRVLSFNEDSVLVDQRTVPLSAAALGNYETLSTGPLIVQQDGYVSMYVGNESAADVYFDDVTIEYRQGLQVQENHYDPFGLDLAGVSGAAPGLRLKNFYQFNGKENQLDLGLNWNHQDARFYDYQLGRWHVVDPLTESQQENWTPYQFGFDNAIRYNDPDGRKVIVRHKDRKELLTNINARASQNNGTFKTNIFGKLRFQENKANSKSSTTSTGSQYYTDQLKQAITSKNKITIAKAQTYDSKTEGKIAIDSEAGGGLTDPQMGDNPNKSDSNKVAKVVISGNPLVGLTDVFGKPLRDDPADILAHELVGHAIPFITKSDTGNAVDNENKVRSQLPSGQNQWRMPEQHPEF